MREDEVVPALDGWLAEVLRPDRMEATCQTLLAAQASVSLCAARRTLAECETKLARYREALEAGTEPSVVAAWIREVTPLKERAQQEVRSLRPRRRLTAEEIREVLRELEDPVRVLATAEPTKKAELYANLDLRLDYQPHDQRVLVEANLAWSYGRVGGGI